MSEDQNLDEILALSPEPAVPVVRAEVTESVSVTAKVDDGKGGKKEVVVKEFERKQVEEKLFVGEPPFKIWMDYSYTKNLGNYESAKISIGVSVPVGVEVTGEDIAKIEKAKGTGMKLLEKFMGEEIVALDNWDKARKAERAKSNQSPFA